MKTLENLIEKRLINLGTHANDYIIKPKVERVVFSFTYEQAAVIDAVLKNYMKLLSEDELAPPKFVELVGRLNWRFQDTKSGYTNYNGVLLKEFSLDTNEFHVIEKSIRILIENLRVLREPVPEELQKLKGFFSEGKPLS